MVLLPFTNIIVDEFSHCKKNKSIKYIHFLTHMHSDHFVGMCEGWNYGRIYCTQISANLLLHKFINVKEVVPLELNTRYTIQIGDKININVTLLDANHCPGAVMFLFQGYMGTYLYTGDIRFDKTVFEKYNELYPDNLMNQRFEGCSKKIDILFLDNTFCDPVFVFPPRNEVLKQIEELVTQCKEKGNRVFIALDNLGKQQILVHLAYKFLSLVVVTTSKYQSLINCQIDNNIFTTTTTQGWIETIPKKDMKKRLTEDPNAVGIIPTGWCNKSFVTFGGRLHMFPYSLHSNYSQLEDFVKSIQPAKIQPIVRNFQNKTKLNEDYGEVVKQNAIYRLSQLKQRGLPQLQEKFTTIQYTIAHKQIFYNTELQKSISNIFRVEEKKQGLFYCGQFRKQKDMQKVVKDNLKKKTEYVQMVERDDSQQISQIRSRLDYYKKIRQQKLLQTQIVQSSKLCFLNKPMTKHSPSSNPISRETKTGNNRKTQRVLKSKNQGKQSQSSIQQQSNQQSCNRQTKKNILKRASDDCSLPVRLKKVKQPLLNEDRETKVIKTQTLTNYFKKVVSRSKQSKQSSKSVQLVFLDN